MKNENQIEDYSQTLNLPKETISSNGDIAKRENFFLNKMQSSNRYMEIVEKNKFSKKVYNIIENKIVIKEKLSPTNFQNKILKDIIIRYELLGGGTVNHKLDFTISDENIENIEKNNIKGDELKKVYNKRIEELNKYSREHIQTIKRLGTVIDYNSINSNILKNNPHTLINNFWQWYKENKITKRVKPIYWCPKCEIKKSKNSLINKKENVENIYVLYKIKKDMNKKIVSDIDESSNIYIVATTTSPYTILFSEHLAVVDDMDYSIIKVNEKNKNVYYITKSDKAEEIMQASFFIKYEVIKQIKGTDLLGIHCSNPLKDILSVEVINAKKEYVILDEKTSLGTSLVSPGSTQNDYNIAKDNNKIKTENIIDKNGKIVNKFAEFNGLSLNDANKKAIDILKSSNKLLNTNKITIDVKHCKECDSNLLYIYQEDWIIKKSYKDNELKELYTILLSKINQSLGHNDKYIENELFATILQKDAVISDKDVLGIPLPIVYCTKCSREVINENLINALNKFFESNNIVDYYNLPLEQILNGEVCCDKCGNTLLNKGNFVFNSFFKTICTSVFNDVNLKDTTKDVIIVIENKEDFLKEIKAISYGKNLDKINNINKILLHDKVSMTKYKNKEPILPEEVIKKYGTDVLRLWCARHANDNQINFNEVDIIYTDKMYKKIRRTFKFITSNLSDFNPLKDMIVTSDCNDLELYIYKKLVEVIKDVELNYTNLNISNVYKILMDFCENELSKEYFEAIKYRLYILAPDDKLRRSSQSMLYKILATLIKYFIPILPITLEEIWPFVYHRNVQEENNLMLYRGRINILDDEFKSAVSKWKNIFRMKHDIKKYINLAISKKQISKSLEAKVTIRQKNNITVNFIKQNAEDILRTLNVSELEIELTDANNITVTKSDGLECKRCKSHSKYLGQNIKYSQLCPLCSEVMEKKNM